jgi:hypothetical protein
LQQLAGSHRKRWQEARGKFTWLDRPTRPVVVEAPQPALHQPKSSKPKPVTTPIPSKRVPREPLRFLLARSSPVVDAPSIGATAAEHLAKVGIRTVADLLNANPESAAEETGEPRITAAVITRWQSEARLACRIPELRCSGAQLLVASGLTEPEQVAAANAAELFAKVRDLCRSPKGKHMLRDGKPPSKERIAQWIRHAAHMRPLEAA